MLNFNIFVPTRLLFGPGKLSELGTTPHLPKGDKAMVVVSQGGSMVRSGYLARVQGLLSDNGVKTIVFDEIRPNPESEAVDRAAAICREKEVDFIVGLGGGSTVDSAKSIALMCANDGEYWDYIHGGSGGGKAPQNPAIPVVAIPTTAGTGTETDPWTVITKSGGEGPNGHPEKIGFGNDSTFPALSIVDPELMTSVPPAVTGHTGMDAFFHAAETFLNINAQPASDMLALEAVHLVSHFLPVAVAQPENMEARALLAWASTAAGYCQAITGVISQHSLEHALSAYAPDLPHGLGLTLLSRSYFSYLAEHGEEGVLDRMGDMAVAMGVELAEEASDIDKGKAFLEALDALITGAGLDGESLAAYGLTADMSEKLARCTMDTMPALFGVTPVDMEEKDVVGIFENALE